MNRTKVIGFVASCDANLATYYSATRAVPQKEDAYAQLEEMFIGALDHFNAVSGSLPEHVIVYRVGNSEGQKDTLVSYSQYSYVF
jgi:hypothetical protein